MTDKVFISYSSRDTRVAEAACAALEAQGIECWIAPRNIAVAGNYQDALIEAISNCRIVALVFSLGANDSPQVQREMERAVSKKKTIITFRIEDVVPNEAFAYEFATRQWIDLFGDWEDSIARLVELIASTIDDHHRASTTPETART